MKYMCDYHDHCCLTCKKTWNKYEVKNMGDYHDHCLKKDVLLLANVFIISKSLFARVQNIMD